MGRCDSTGGCSSLSSDNPMSCGDAEGGFGPIGCCDSVGGCDSELQRLHGLRRCYGRALSSSDSITISCCDSMGGHDSLGPGDPRDCGDSSGGFGSIGCCDAMGGCPRLASDVNRSDPASTSCEDPYVEGAAPVAPTGAKHSTSGSSTPVAPRLVRSLNIVGRLTRDHPALL